MTFFVGRFIFMEHFTNRTNVCTKTRGYTHYRFFEAKRIYFSSTKSFKGYKCI